MSFARTTLLALCLTLASTLSFANDDGFNTGKEFAPTPVHVRIIPTYDPKDYDRIFNDYLDMLAIGLNPKADIPDRIARASEFFLGKPYMLNPLGEGPFAYFDRAPLYRSDRFDCLTYVETVLALAESKNLDEFQSNILKIRYRSPKNISFVNRNHFVEQGWNQTNIKNRFIKEITTKLGLPTEQANAMIDKSHWFRHLKASRIQLFDTPGSYFQAQIITDLHNLSTKVMAEPAQMNYIPLEVFFINQNGKWIPNMEAFNRIPSGAIIEIIRPNWDLTDSIGTELLISHLGFAIRQGDVLTFRHSSSEQQKVVDINMIDYFGHYVALGSRTSVKGVAIFMPK